MRCQSATKCLPMSISKMQRVLCIFHNVSLRRRSVVLKPRSAWLGKSLGKAWPSISMLASGSEVMVACAVTGQSAKTCAREYRTGELASALAGDDKAMRCFPIFLRIILRAAHMAGQDTSQ